MAVRTFQAQSDLFVDASAGEKTWGKLVVAAPTLFAGEVFLGLAFGDGNSYLNLRPDYIPDGDPGYALRDFAKYAIG